MALVPETMLSATKVLRVSSAEELRAQYLQQSKKNRNFILAVDDFRFLSRIFLFSDVPLRDVAYNIIAEAQDLLSLPADEIVYDYQVFSHKDNIVRGIFICAPAALVHEYLFICQKTGLIPVSVTSSVLTSLNTCLLREPLQDSLFAFLDFSGPGVVNIVVLEHEECIFLRQVYFQSLAEVKTAVVQSLRHACTQSVLKKFSNIFYLGQIPEQDVIWAELAKAFEIKPQMLPAEPSKRKQLGRNLKLPVLNVAKSFVLPLKVRRVILLSFYLAIFPLVVTAMFLAMDIHTAFIKLKVLEKKFDPVDYEQALLLSGRLQNEQSDASH